MKTSIITLGIAMMVFTSSKANSNFTNEAAKSVKAAITVFENLQGDSFENASAGDNKTFAPVEDHTILNPETVLNLNYHTAIEDVIKADNKIIESNITDENSFVDIGKSIEETIFENNQIIENETNQEIRPLYIDRTIEDVIAEDNAIIESNFVSQVQPLDFETINKKAFTLKQNKLVGMN